MNRPKQFNPLSTSMIAALHSEMEGLSKDSSVRVIVLAAEGRGFCAGHDLREIRTHLQDHAWQRKLFDDCSKLMLLLTRVPQPVVARVHGLAHAAGCQLVAMCDMAIASESATFALPGLNVGIFCTSPAVAVARNIGRKRVMEMLLTGEPITAATALDWGLVNHVVPQDKVAS
jgi:enoyl-CoA hydratase/carnithine racemase